MDTPKASDKVELKELRVAMSPDNAKPIFCNIAQFSKVKDDYVLMTLIFAEPDGSGNGSILGRFVIDVEHAKQFVKVLDGVLKKKVS